MTIQLFTWESFRRAYAYRACRIPNQFRRALRAQDFTQARQWATGAAPAKIGLATHTHL